MASYIIVNIFSSNDCHVFGRQMETFSALLALCEGNPPVTGGFPTQKPATRSFDVFSDPRLDLRLDKLSRGRWIDMPERSLWRHCNASHYLLH